MCCSRWPRTSSLLYRLDCFVVGMLCPLGRLRNRRLLHGPTQFQCRSWSIEGCCFEERGRRQSLIGLVARFTFYKEDSGCRSQKHVEELKRLVKRPKSLSAATSFPSRTGLLSTHLPRSTFRVSHEFCLSSLSHPSSIVLVYMSIDVCPVDLFLSCDTMSSRWLHKQKGTSAGLPKFDDN